MLKQRIAGNPRLAYDALCDLERQLVDSTKHNTALRALVRELVNALESELRSSYDEYGKVYKPPQLVARAKAALGEGGT
jgi:hypothetical protein